MIIAKEFKDSTEKYIIAQDPTQHPHVSDLACLADAQDRRVNVSAARLSSWNVEQNVHYGIECIAFAVLVGRQDDIGRNVVFQKWSFWVIVDKVCIGAG